ncbi:MAG: hypothetical protein Q7J44_22690 [Pseudotabrizicola sp.]|uniref:hypothetical protein n=1 Tax=Pseudotabrizicola sp. TaxID=2939647 RepID=UPI002726E1F1|nr:hypothetical protein [Pseudotabrizicola sp.]MDO9641344.1 hypothetical protein [Pseudotabrizicola sp.]
MDNLEQSELVIAKILGLLMEWGLTETEMRFEELGLEEDFRQFFTTCIEWLEAEGIIRVKKVHKFIDGHALIERPTITAHGFRLMGITLSVGQQTTTIGAAVKQTSKDTGFYTGLGDLGGGFVGGLLKSLGSA